MNFRPDRLVGFIPLPLVKKPLDEVRDAQNAQKQTREKRHEPGLGGMKGPEAELEAPEANQGSKGDPNQIIDQESFLHRQKFSRDWRQTIRGKKYQDQE